MNSPEPILDVVRGLSTVASFGIVVTHIKQVWDDIFTGHCEFCKGTGIVTCKHCKGTKTLRKEAAQLSVLDSRYVDGSNDSTYLCHYCPDVSKYDFDFEGEDNEMEAYTIQDNLKAAMSNKPRPHQLQVLAGTQRCPECWGAPIVRRHTPNFPKVLNLEIPIFRKVQRAIGIYQFGDPNLGEPQHYIEYPIRPSSPIPKETYKRPVKGQQGSGESMSAKDQLTLDDYILPYIDDSDSDED